MVIICKMSLYNFFILVDFVTHFEDTNTFGIISFIYVGH